MGVFQKTGAKVHGIWYSFGEYDTAIIVEFDKAEDAAAVAIALRAGWDGKAFDNVKITPLLTQEEAARACAEAASGLKESRDATKAGPLTGTMDYSNQDFSKKGT